MYRECIGFHSCYVGQHAKIKPTYEKLNGIWYPVIPEDFAPQSTVFDYSPRHELVVTYQLCYFLCEDNVNKRKSSDDDFIVVRDTQDFLYKILDYSFLPIDQVRKNIFFDGVSLEDEKGETQRIFYIYLKNNTLIKVSFCKNIENEKWYADYLFGQSESNNLIESYFLEDGLNSTFLFKFRNNKYLLNTDFQNLESLGLMDWSADYAFHEKTLSYFSRISKDNLDNIEFPSINNIKKLTSLMQANELFPDVADGYINKSQYLERTSELTTHTSFIIKTYRKLYSELSLTSGFKTYIEQQVEEYVEQHSKQILKDKLDEAEKKHNLLLKNFENQIAEKQIENEKLSLHQDNLKRSNLTLQKSVDNFKEVFSQFINEAGKLSLQERNVIERLDCFLMDRDVLQKRSLLPSVLPPWSSIHNLVQTKIVNMTEINSIWASLAATYGYQSRNVQVFDHLVRTGHLVILINEYAHLFVENYSRLICGGRISHVALDASYIGIDDLWRSPGTHLNTGFSYAWHNAINNPEKYYIVHLTGIMEINYSDFFKQLSQILSYPQSPKNLLIVGSLTTNLETLEDKQKKILKNISGFFEFLQFNSSEISPLIALSCLDKTKYSEILYLENIKRYGIIKDSCLNTFAEFLKVEKKHRISDIPEHLFLKQENQLTSNEQLEAKKTIEAL